MSNVPLHLVVDMLLLHIVFFGTAFLVGLYGSRRFAWLHLVVDMRLLHIVFLGTPFFVEVFMNLAALLIAVPVVRIRPCIFHNCFFTSWQTRDAECSITVNQQYTLIPRASNLWLSWTLHSSNISSSKSMRRKIQQVSKQGLRFHACRFHYFLILLAH